MKRSHPLGGLHGILLPMCPVCADSQARLLGAAPDRSLNRGKWVDRIYLQKVADSAKINNDW